LPLLSPPRTLTETYHDQFLLHPFRFFIHNREESDYLGNNANLVLNCALITNWDKRFLHSLVLEDFKTSIRIFSEINIDIFGTNAVRKRERNGVKLTGCIESDLLACNHSACQYNHIQQG
jgi:hypothetical protein